MSRLPASLRLAVPLALAGALLACGEASEPPTGQRAAQASRASASARSPLPAAGEILASREAGRYTLLASEISPAAALAELSVLAGFRVEPEAGELPAGPLRLELRGVRFEQALAAILGGVAYQVHYEFADGDLTPRRSFAGRPVVLSRVTIREPGSGALAPAGAPDPDARAAMVPVRENARSEEALERAERRDEADARERERAAAVERDWRDARASVRLDAVEQMEPEDADDRRRLASLLRDDPSSEVRSAAAERLAEGNPFHVREPLLEALGDPDPAVVASAIGALEEVYAEVPDPRIRELVTGLRGQRDAAVREAVASFEEWTDE